MKKKPFLALLLLALAGFFIWPSFCQAAVYINEVVWMGTTESANYEWLELYNNGEAEIDLTGWILAATDGTPTINLAGKIPAGNYFLLERTSDATLPTVTADQIYTGALGNSGEILELKDSGGNLIDRVDASGGWPAGNNETKQTMSRTNDNAWQTSQNTNGTPEAVNDFETAPPPETPPEETPATATTTAPATENLPASTSELPVYKAGDILINEFVADPSDDDVEWVELYNITPQNFNLTDWWLEDGTEAKTKISGQIPGQKFLVIEKPKGNLNNAGDIIILKDSAGCIIDQVVYGNWQDGELADNAPMASDPNSVARIFDGFNSTNDAADFKVTTSPTKAEPNQISQNPLLPASQTYSKNVVINEVLPNPAGSDEEAEFIEIKNIGELIVDLTGWQLGDATTNRYQIDNLIIEPKKILIFYRTKTNLALNNSGFEKIILFWPDKETASEASYSGVVPENQSFSRDETGDWFWTASTTPGEENKIIKTNEPPTAVINGPTWSKPNEFLDFDASDSFDPEHEPLQFFWDFGDGRTDTRVIAKQIYTKIGSYQITLKVTDSQNASSTATQKIVISENQPSAAKNTITSSASGQKSTPQILGSEFMPIYISEYLPNPVGLDTEGEFIELFNPNNFLVDLAGWQLDDAEGGSRPYTIPTGYQISVNQYLTFPFEETNIALNNDADQVRLFDSFGQLVDFSGYEKTAEGSSFIRDETGRYIMTGMSTPGEINTLNEIKISGVSISETAIAEAREAELQSEIIASGQVLVEPGILGSQFFYLGDQTGGIQVYMFKKDWPALKPGDQIQVNGVITQSRGEPRIKLSDKDDIKISGNNTALTPTILTIADLSEKNFGSLVQITGVVTESKAAGFYIDDDTDELYVTLKKSAGLIRNFQLGDTVQASGILTSNDSGLQLLPRHQTDIKLIQAADSSVIDESDETPLTQSKSFNRYLIAAIVALALIIFKLIFKIRKIESANPN